MKAAGVAAFLSLTWLASLETRAQGCCSPGTPSLSSLERGSLSGNALVIGLGYEYGLADRVIDVSKTIDDPLRRSATINAFFLEGAYGFDRRFSVAGVFTYVTKDRDVTTRDPLTQRPEEVHLEGNGIGDALVLIKYALIPLKLSSQLEFSVGAGWKIPFGDYLQAPSDVRLSIDLQPGSGALDGLLWAYLYKGFRPAPVRSYASFLYRFTGTNPEGYKIGNEWLGTLGADYSLLDYLDLSLHLRGRYSERDYADGRWLVGTGGFWLYLTPSIIYREGSNVAFRFYAQFPAYENVRGIQLTSTYTVGISVQYALNI